MGAMPFLDVPIWSLSHLSGTAAFDYEIQYEVFMAFMVEGGKGTILGYEHQDTVYVLRDSIVMLVGMRGLI